MRISDWSSDVCSSDLPHRQHRPAQPPDQHHRDDQPPGPRRAHPPHPSRVGASFVSAMSRLPPDRLPAPRSEEHTSELQSLMRISYAVFCLKKKKLQIKLNHKDSTNNYSCYVTQSLHCTT